MKKKDGSFGKSFYGVVAVGQRGQVVIPKQARDELGIKPGDKLLVLGGSGRGVVLVKAEQMRDFAEMILKTV